MSKLVHSSNTNLESQHLSITTVDKSLERNISKEIESHLENSEKESFKDSVFDNPDLLYEFSGLQPDYLETVYIELQSHDIDRQSETLQNNQQEFFENSGPIKEYKDDEESIYSYESVGSIIHEREWYSVSGMKRTYKELTPDLKTDNPESKRRETCFAFQKFESGCKNGNENSNLKMQISESKDTKETDNQNNCLESNPKQKKNKSFDEIFIASDLNDSVIFTNKETLTGFPKGCNDVGFCTNRISEITNEKRIKDQEHTPESLPNVVDPCLNRNSTLTHVAQTASFFSTMNVNASYSMLNSLFSEFGECNSNSDDDADDENYSVNSDLTNSSFDSFSDTVTRCNSRFFCDNKKGKGKLEKDNVDSILSEHDKRLNSILSASVAGHGYHLSSGDLCITGISSPTNQTHLRLASQLKYHKPVFESSNVLGSSESVNSIELDKNRDTTLIKHNDANSLKNPQRSTSEKYERPANESTQKALDSIFATVLDNSVMAQYNKLPGMPSDYKVPRMDVKAQAHRKVMAVESDGQVEKSKEEVELVKNFEKFGNLASTSDKDDLVIN